MRANNGLNLMQKRVHQVFEQDEEVNALGRLIMAYKEEPEEDNEEEF